MERIIQEKNAINTQLTLSNSNFKGERLKFELERLWN